MGLKSDDSVQMDNEREIAATEIDESCFDELDTGKFVAAMYEDTWYIGKVEEIDRDDRDGLISCDLLKLCLSGQISQIKSG